MQFERWLIILDFEDKKDALPVGEKTMKVLTTRMSHEDIATIKTFASILQYERKQQARVPFQEALHLAVLFLKESKEQDWSKPQKNNIAETLQSERQPENIAHEILQDESNLQMDAPPQQDAPLQNASNEQDIIAGLTKADREKLLNQRVSSFEPYIAKSKQEEKPNNVIEFTQSKKILLETVFPNE